MAHLLHMLFFALFHPILFREYRRAQKITGCYNPENLALTLRKRVGPYSGNGPYQDLYGPYFLSSEPLRIAQDLYTLRHNIRSQHD